MLHQFMLHKNKFKCRTDSLLLVNMNEDEFEKVRIVTVLSLKAHLFDISCKRCITLALSYVVQNSFVHYLHYYFKKAR